MNVSRTMKLVLFTIVLAMLFCLGETLAFGQSGIPTGTQHSVKLTWQAPSPVGGSGVIAGYNVYRSPSGPPSFTKVNSTPVVGLTTTDATVTAGTTYAYCATTVDSSGEESACSIQVSANVPTNPNVPSNLAVTVQ